MPYQIASLLLKSVTFNNSSQHLISFSNSKALGKASFSAAQTQPFYKLLNIFSPIEVSVFPSRGKYDTHAHNRLKIHQP